MFLIKLREKNTDGTEKKYWTEKYKESKDGDFLEFESKSKQGKIFKHLVNKSMVEEIVDVGEMIDKTDEE